MKQTGEDLLRRFKKQLTQEELALQQGMPLTRFNNIKQAEVRKRGK